MKPCNIAGCERPAVARGMCLTHYTRVKRTGSAELDPARRARPQEPKPAVPCSVPGCRQAARARGMCQTHYLRMKKTGTTDLPVRPGPKPCSVEACENVAAAKGLCEMHYARLRKHGTTADLPIQSKWAGRTCAVDGCGRDVVAKGYCTMHYQRWATHGDPGPPSRKIAVRGERSWINSYGYRMLSGKSGGTPEHRVVMEEILGRPLVKGETVHHRNGVRHDNRPTNLQLWVTSQPSGQRPRDLVAWANEIIARYGRMVEERKPFA